MHHSTSQQPKISINGLCKSFGHKHVLSSVDLDIFPGESVVIIGQSGMGKSVFLRLILGLMGADAGTVHIDGENYLRYSTHKREIFLSKIGMLFQGGALFDSLPVWENICFGLIHNQKLSRKQAKSLSVEFLADVGLQPEVALLYPADLSGGMQKRVSLARTIATNPEILFLMSPQQDWTPL